MRKVTFQSADAYLLDDWFNPRVKPVLDVVLPVNVETGITQRETRSQLDDTLRLAYRFTITLRTLADITQFRNSLQDYSTQPILCPLWVAKRAPSEFHPVTADYYLHVLDDDTTEVLDATAAGALPYDPEEWVVPLMVGCLDEWPEPDVLTTDFAEVQISFRETSTFKLSFAAFSTTGGPVVNGVTPSLFPWRHNTHRNPVSQAASSDVDRVTIGEGRVADPVFYAQPSRRAETRAYMLRDDAAWSLLRYFLDLGAARAPLWLPSALQEANLTADVGSSATSLPVDNAGARGLNATFLLDDGITRTPVKVTGTSGSSWTLSGAIGAAYDKDDTSIFSLQLSRFADGKLSLSFETDTLATAELRFLEIPWETVSPPDETYGVTTGSIGQKAFLYTFTTTLLGSVTTWRFTSFSRDLTFSGNTWNRAQIDHGDITEVIGFDFASVSLQSIAFSGNPLLKLSPMTLEAPLVLEINECTVSGNTASSLTCVFYGEVEGRNARIKGPRINASAKSFGRLLDIRFPKTLVQTGDNFTLFDTGNGLSRASWTWDAAVISWTPSTFTLVVGPLTKAAVAYSGTPQGFFANGAILIGSGSAAQLRRVSDHPAQSGTSLSLVMASDMVTPSVGDPVKLYPGYDLQYSTAKAKFSNGAKFGGFPYMPLSNPSLTKVTQALSTGGKK